MESNESLGNIAQRLRSIARDIEAATVKEGSSVAAVSVTPIPREPERHQWDDLRDISILLWSLSGTYPAAEAKRRAAISRLEEIADSLEDMYEENRDH